MSVFVVIHVMSEAYMWAVKPRVGTRFKYKNLTFYAIEGLIAMHDERPLATLESSDYTVHLPADIAERARILADYGKNLQSSPKPEVREDGRVSLRAAQEMLEAVREARHMGDPSDPRVQEYWQKHHKRPTISIGSKTADRYPELPPMPKGQITGRTLLADDPKSDKLANQVAAKLTEQVRQLPRRKQT